MDIISAKEAKDKNQSQYFTGHACPKGHIAPRFVSTHACTVCVAAKAQQWRATHKEHRRIYRNKWNKENKNKVRAHRKKFQPKARAWQNKNRTKNVLPYLIYQAKARAKKKQIPFDITTADLLLPKTCPVLGIPIILGKKKQVDGSPTIDRIIPNRGYVRGNICVISAKANRIKNDALLEELKKVVKYFEEKLEIIGDKDTKLAT